MPAMGADDVSAVPDNRAYAPPSDRSELEWNALVSAILLLGFVVRLYLLLKAHSTEEDFYITLRYAENIAHGHGFVYNPGQQVLGTTNPLYTLILAAAIKLGIPGVKAARIIGLAADAATGWFTFRLAKSINRPACGAAAALCLALAPINLTAATRGMEVGLVAAVGIACWAFWAEGKDLAAWFCAALLAMLRIDGAVLAVFLCVASLLPLRQQPRDSRKLARGIGVFALTCAPWFMFAAAYFGSPIPLSLKAKLTVYGKLIPGRFPHLAEFVRLMLHNPLGLALAAGTALQILFLLASLRTRKAGALAPEWALAPPLCWIGLHYAGMALSHVLLFGWYFVPPTPVYSLCATVGFAMAASAWLPSLIAKIKPSHRMPAFTCAALVMANITVPRVETTLVQDQKVETGLRIPIGKYMAEVSRPGESLMLEPIGYIGYYSRMRIIDVIGLISPEALPSYAKDVPEPDHDLWQRLKPDWLLLRAGQRQDLQRYENTLPEASRLTASYTLAHSWTDSDAPAAPPVFYLYRRNPGASHN
jgi:arabinofuranosyltransferase